MVSERWKAGKNAVLAVALSIVLLAGFSSTAFAGTLFTYSGTDIWSKASINQAEVSASTCYVSHNQTKQYGRTGVYMVVRVEQKSGLLSWNTVGSRSFLDTASGTFSTYCPSGTYRLYFLSSETGHAFDINGRFYN